MTTMTPMPPTPVRDKAGLGAQVLRFAGVGVLSTVVHLGLFAAFLHAGMAGQLANLTSLVIATIGNTALNRAWTFGAARPGTALRHHVEGLLVFAITAGATSASLAVLTAVAPTAPPTLQTLVVGVGTAASTMARFLVMRRW